VTDEAGVAASRTPSVRVQYCMVSIDARLDKPVETCHIKSRRSRCPRRHAGKNALKRRTGCRVAAADVVHIAHSLAGGSGSCIQPTPLTRTTADWISREGSHPQSAFGDERHCWIATGVPDGRCYIEEWTQSWRCRHSKWEAATARCRHDARSPAGRTSPPAVIQSGHQH
jgi:hypothetical protein